MVTIGKYGVAMAAQLWKHDKKRRRRRRRIVTVIWRMAMIWNIHDGHHSHPSWCNQHSCNTTGWHLCGWRVPSIAAIISPSSHLKILVNQPHPNFQCFRSEINVEYGYFWPPQPHFPLLKAFISQTNQAPSYQGWVWLTRSHPPFFVVRLAMSLPTATAVVDVVHHEPQRLDRSIYRSVS